MGLNVKSFTLFFIYYFKVRVNAKENTLFMFQFMINSMGIF